MTNLSQAQTAHQGNRTQDGKYTFGTHAEPDGLALDTSAPAPAIEIRNTTMDELLERPELFEGRYIQTDVAIHNQLQQGYLVDVRDHGPTETELVLNQGSKDDPKLNSVMVSRGMGPMNQPWTVAAHLPWPVVDEANTPAPPKEERLPDGHRIPVDFDHARYRGLQARYPEVDTKTFESIHERLERAREKGWDRGVLIEVEKMAQQEGLDEGMVWDTKNSLGDPSTSSGGNPYPRLGGIRQVDQLAVEASGAQFDNSFIDRATGRLTLNTPGGPFQVRGDCDGRLQIRKDDRWAGAANGQSDAEFWSQTARDSVDFRAADRLGNAFGSGEITGTFDEDTGEAKFIWSDGDGFNAEFSYSPEKGLWKDGNVATLNFFGAKSTPSGNRMVPENLEELARTARERMIWHPMVERERRAHRTGAIQTKFQSIRASERLQEDLEVEHPNIFKRNFKNGVGVGTSTAKWDAGIIIGVNGERSYVLNNRPATAEEFTSPKMKKLVKAFEAKEQELRDLAEARRVGLG